MCDDKMSFHALSPISKRPCIAAASVLLLISQPVSIRTSNTITVETCSYAAFFTQEDGSKRTIRGVFRRLKRLGYDVEMIWREIGRLATKTIIAILPELKVEHHFEVLSVRPGLSCFQVTCTGAFLRRNFQDCTTCFFSPILPNA